MIVVHLKLNALPNQPHKLCHIVVYHHVLIVQQADHILEVPVAVVLVNPVVVVQGKLSQWPIDHLFAFSPNSTAFAIRFDFMY